MEIFQNPNILYLLLTGGLALGILAIGSPGTGVLELLAVALLAAAGGLMAAYDIPVNLWALAVLIIGAALFAMAVRRPRHLLWLALSILALVLGSAYLFASADRWRPGVDPLLAIAVSLALGGFFWIAARKVMEAEMATPRHDLGALIGAVGEAKSPIHKEGSVYVNGELWSARSHAPIADGAAVRVLERDGFELLVEPLAPAARPAADEIKPTTHKE
jgi:membrane-bound serine protease (ClpP class)